ncbi:ABC transporter permease [Bradyrhizobium sp. JYMT SZCCT0428]|uniref:ABC transporter permease n=1 Tax=Bradyrhizobium sp. JYMT SZCCT0428 TaxID=2807673 RepID=UPI001BAA4969|nr:ABC transporter permease [Bradyrhizobium sp. JYMT SZCCT0428]MBR1151567.1 ABC transporter permease [Bradyrhizobium sp. JYMT SZCCT0428]
MTELITIIRRRRGWFDLKLSRVWNHRDLLLLFAMRDIKVRHKQTLLGPGWLVLQPLVWTAVFTATISGVAGVSTGNQPAPLFYLCGLIVWSYFSQIIFTTSQVFIANEHLFSKVYFPRIILPVSALLSNGVALLIQFVVILIFAVAYGWMGKIDGLSWRILLFPIVVVQLAAFSLAVGLVLGASTAKYRDMGFMTPFLVQVSMFVTPVLYPFSFIPERYRTLTSFVNPLAVLVEESRWCFLGHSHLEANQVIASVLSTLAVLAAGVIVYQRVERTVMDTI